jgi:A/G-specific adenine glycosylase
MKFSNTLIHWYLQNREICHVVPTYAIWLSKSCFNKLALLKVRLLIFSLSAAFPTVFLIWPDEEEVLKLWQGLGYYSRANLHKTAQYVAWELAGVFPDNYSDLLKLKVGEYTAAAIASLQ